jgi:hypothetical protein
MKIYDYTDIPLLPPGRWIDCKEALPPAGEEVIVVTGKGKVTALSRFDRYENSLPDEGWWDNRYPGKGNMHLFKNIVAWMPMPAGPGGKR